GPGEHYRATELIVVDDGSTDEPVARLAPLLLRHPSIRVIRLARRFGPDVALAAGLDSAIGDYVVLMEPEGDPPAEVPAMVELARAGHGVVTGVATRRHGERWVQRALRRLFHGLCEGLFGISYPRYATRFQVLTPAAAAARMRSQCPQWPVLAAQVGYGGATHAYERLQRPQAGRGRLRDKIDRGLSILVLNSRSPLRLVSYLGIAAGALNLLYAGYV